MTPSYHAFLVNGRQGDPALYVDFRFEKRALLFDLGDLHALAPRKLLRVSDVFVSHMHLDHFVGFDQLLRLLLGREKTVGVWGPDGIIDCVAARLGGYSWNLAARYKTDLCFQVTEVGTETAGRTATFRLKDRFRPAGGGVCRFEAGTVLFRQDDPPGDMFVLLAGRVKVEQDGQSLGELGRGDSLGTWALFEDEPWQATATALEAVSVLRIDRVGFEDALHENPEIARSLIRQLVRRIRTLAG